MFGVHKLAWLRRDSSKYLRLTLVKGLAWQQVAVHYRKTSNNFLIFSSCALLREKLAHLNHWLCTEKIITAFLPTPNSCPTNDTCCCSTDHFVLLKDSLLVWSALNFHFRLTLTIFTVCSSYVGQRYVISALPHACLDVRLWWLYSGAMETARR